MKKQRNSDSYERATTFGNSKEDGRHSYPTPPRTSPRSVGPCQSAISQIIDNILTSSRTAFS